MSYAEKDPKGLTKIEAWLLAFVFIAVMIILGSFCCSKAKASPLYFTLDTGLTAFKFGDQTTRLGFPHFDTPKWDVESGLEWAPAPLEDHGMWFRFSFRWQSLGRQANWFHDGQTYIDGPRLGIRFRGKLGQ